MKPTPPEVAVEAEVDEFAQFVAARQRTLQRTAWLITGDYGQAEDLVQTALAKAWPRWDRIRRRDDPEIYVRRVMLNTWLTWRRRRWRGEKAADYVPDTAAPGDLAGDVAVRVAVRRALGALSAPSWSCACSTTCPRHRSRRCSTARSGP
jgi:DNA-directed RNA polymerase specialized sigma24 family protein